MHTEFYAILCKEFSFPQPQRAFKGQLSPLSLLIHSDFWEQIEKDSSRHYRSLVTFGPISCMFIMDVILYNERANLDK